MNKNFNYIFVFAMILFIGLGVACASDVDDAASAVQDAGSLDVADVAGSPLGSVVADSSKGSGNLPLEDDVGDDTDPGANPTQYNNISQTTYENAVITLSNDQSFTDGVATFGSNVTLTSAVSQKTLTNFKIVVSGQNVTINNVKFNHQTGTATKVIDVSGGGNVLINNTDITLTKNSAVTTMGVSVSDNADGVVVNNSSIVVNAAAQTLWHQYPNGTWYDELMVSGVTVDRASNVVVANSTVQMFNTTDTVLSGTTMPAVSVKNTANVVDVVNNTINSTGATYVYGVMCNDYVSSINLSGNKVNVTGEIYTAGIDASTTINSYVTYNKIYANSTNHEGFGYRQEALAYGVVLATYQTGNSNNNVSYNDIDLVANVGYGIENYMGSNNKVDFNNVTIDAKRGLGIATNASSSNYYRNNKINITCNPDAINAYDESIPAQNVGIVVINGSTNTINDNKINITEDVATTTAYAIKLYTDSTDNEVQYNYLYVYGNNGIQKWGQNSISGSDSDNEIINNFPSVMPTQNQQNVNKAIKQDDSEIIVIDVNNNNQYLSITDSLQVISIPENSEVVLDVASFNKEFTRLVLSNLNGVSMKIIDNNTYRIMASGSNFIIHDTYLPYANITGSSSAKITLINCVFFGSSKASTWFNLENTTIYGLEDNFLTMDNDHYGRYFDTQTNILSDTVSGEKTILLRSYTENGRKLNNYNNPMIINKPVNITSFDNAKYNGDISFVAGSEGSNITGLTLNGNLYINTGNINVKNNTVNNAVYIHDASNVVVEENVFNMDTIPIELTSSITSTIRNNNITTGSDYTITLDSECAENTITGNDLIAGTLQGDNSVLDNGQDNSISLNTPIVYTPELVVDTTEFSVGSPATITASIYLGEEVDTNVNKGKVVFKVNGKTLKDVSTGKVIYAKVTGGVATITDYEIPLSWAKDNITIQAVYSGSSQCDALRAEANLTVTKDSPAITTSDVTASKGETVTLTATVAAGDTPVNVGKVIFKVNGKTVKDSNGKVIYASVVNGQVSVNYTVPENMKAGSYNITVTFTAPGYEKLTDTKTLTVSA